MRLAGWIGLLLGTLLASPVRGDPGAGGDYYARIRANDAPIAGRFTIAAYFLDSLDVAVHLPGPGRILAVHFRESNGENAFLIPGDLVLEGRDQTRWTGGFAPLGEARLAGQLPKGEGRWALWWIPVGQDTLHWESPADLKLHYGFSESAFVPLKEKDARSTRDAFPWAEATKAVLDPSGSTANPVAPDPAAFDQAPEVKTRRNPEYPYVARAYGFEGSVHLVVRVNEAGRVEDAYVLQSDALHELKVSALVAVMEWVFHPGRKEGRPVAGEMIIPIRFSLGTVK